MPTFRNDGERAVICTEPDGRNIIIFDPGKEIGLTYWIPYQRLGLTLVDGENPAVPDSLLISGEFMFERGMERKINIEPCRKYELDIIPIRGAVSLYIGSSGKGRVISQAEYHGLHEWQYAPYIRLAGVSETSAVRVEAVLKE